MRALCLFDKQNLVSKCERMTASPEPNPAPRRAIARMRVTFARPAVGKQRKKQSRAASIQSVSSDFRLFPPRATRHVCKPRRPHRPPLHKRKEQNRGRPAFKAASGKTRALPPNRMRAAGASAFKHVFDFSRSSNSPVSASNPGQVIHRFFLF